MKYTKNYRLNKPEGTDKFDIEHFNSNFERIDTEIKNATNGMGYVKKAITSTPDGTGAASLTIGTRNDENGNLSVAIGEKVIAKGKGAIAVGFGSNASGAFSHAEGTFYVDKLLETIKVKDVGQEVVVTASIQGIEKNKIDLDEWISESTVYLVSQDVNYDDAESILNTTKKIEVGEYVAGSGEYCFTVDKASHSLKTGDKLYLIRLLETVSTGDSSHAEGIGTFSEGEASHAEGINTSARGMASHSSGFKSVASANGGFAHGVGATADNCYSVAFGFYNAQMQGGATPYEGRGTAFVIGNGLEAYPSNALSLSYGGVLKTASTITASTAADYAEYFEWKDGNSDNEDRVGYFVTLDGNMIKKATEKDDYILGVVSGNPCILGNGDCDVWNGRLLRDEFRRVVIEEDSDGGHAKLNPEYDNTRKYINRSDRPEWSAVGMLGVLPVRQDGTLKVNGYASVNKDGIATNDSINKEKRYRVIKIISENVAEIIFR